MPTGRSRPTAAARRPVSLSDAKSSRHQPGPRPAGDIARRWWVRHAPPTAGTNPAASATAHPGARTARVRDTDHQQDRAEELSTAGGRGRSAQTVTSAPPDHRTQYTAAVERRPGQKIETPPSSYNTITSTRTRLRRATIEWAGSWASSAAQNAMAPMTAVAHTTAVAAVPVRYEPRTPGGQAQRDQHRPVSGEADARDPAERECSMDRRVPSSRVGRESPGAFVTG